MVDVKERHINIIFALNRGKKYYESLQNIESSFRRADNRNNTSSPSSEEV
jgi:hypothetical protein